MLSLEYLLEEAESNGLPIVKRRGILREYIQVMILHSVYRHALGRDIFFMGGTALRFFYNMPRFSEDLDFDTSEVGFGGFKEILAHVEKGLLKEGFSPEVSSQERGNLYTAELLFKDFMKLFGVVDKRGLDMMIKLEVYRPAWRLHSEPAVLSLYGHNFTSTLLDKSNIISEKLCALLNRKRGRDIYDILFMLKKRFPFDEGVLKANNLEGAPKRIILERLAGLPERELKYLARQVQPFLFKEDDIETVLKAPLYAERFLREYE